MKTLEIVFEQDNGFVPRVIRWLTRSDVNHVALRYLSEDWTSEWVAEAAARGVRAVPDHGRKWKHRFIVKYNAVADVQAAQKYIGERYDFVGLVLFGVFIVAWRWLKVKLRRPMHPTSGQFCSEFVAHMLNPKIPFPEPQWVTPQDILLVCQDRVDLFQKVESP